MIELIFVIIILGVLAAIAVPKLSATRDDAELATIKNDISILVNAVPIHYQGSKNVLINKAVSLDLTKWVKSTHANDEAYTYSLYGKECVTVAIWDMNSSSSTLSVSDTAQLGTDINETSGYWLSGASYKPYLRIIKGSNDPSIGYDSTSLCNSLWNDLGLRELNISLRGDGVKF